MANLRLIADADAHSGSFIRSQIDATYMFWLHLLSIQSFNICYIYWRQIFDVLHAWVVRNWSAQFLLNFDNLD
jgi:hypothetical protein